MSEAYQNSPPPRSAPKKKLFFCCRRPRRRKINHGDFSPSLFNQTVVLNREESSHSVSPYTASRNLN